MVDKFKEEMERRERAKRRQAEVDAYQRAHQETLDRLKREEQAMKDFWNKSQKKN
jgi:hypothetical protein